MGSRNNEVFKGKKTVERLICINILLMASRLRRVFVLIGSDCGFKETDRMMLSNLNDLGISYQILITKIDKLKKHPEALSALFFEAKNIIETYGSSGFPEILGIKCIQPVAGISNLRWAILRACGW